MVSIVNLYEDLLKDIESIRNTWFLKDRMDKIHAIRYLIYKFKDNLNSNQKKHLFANLYQELENLNTKINKKKRIK
ncbi:hypothetical protein IC213_19955 [Clostridioides sp. ES-S-0049-02]|uniref:hypothetical protein n=1 Tax=unclassified Clostridioides TaxID=2635829 RepID=UPI001D0BFEA1|nr:hypothetical protein [Clostridioides sp. ES-S-0049-02]MCC0764798.1 hypothetical protein [Clostridioides sp. ES-S-0006-03]